MQRKSPRVLSLFLALVLLVSLAGCNSGSDNPPASTGDGEAATDGNGDGEAAPSTDGASGANQIVIGRTSDANYLDPCAETIGGAEANVLNQIYEGLVTNAQDGSGIVPWLAESWEISDDGLEYTFKLRPGILFSNGEPVTTDDWIWSLMRAKETTTSSYQFLADAISSVEAVSDDEIKIILDEPSANFLACLCNFNLVVASKAHYDEVGPEEFLQSPMGTGAYRLVEWRKEEYILLEANPYYHEDGQPLTPEIKFVVVSDDNTRFMQLQAGQIDHAGDMPFTMVDQINATDGLELEVFPSTQIRYLLLNTTIAPFDDVNVRQALYTGLNKQEISDLVAGDFGAPVAALVSETQSKWHNASLPVSDYDPEGTKAALAEAGYTEDIPFTISISAGNEVYEQIAVLMKSQLDQAGFTVTIEQLERAAFQDLYQSLNHQATILQWFDDILDPSGVVGWTCDYNMSNAWYTGLVDQELEDLNKAADKEMDEAKRVEMYQELQQRVYDNANVIPLFRNGYAHAHGSDLKGLFVNPFNIYRAEFMYKD